MSWLDKRTVKTRTAWSLSPGRPFNPELTVDPARRAASTAPEQGGQVAYLIDGAGIDPDRLLEVRYGDRLLGYAARDPMVPGMARASWDGAPQGYVFPRPGGTVKHSGRREVTVPLGDHMLTFNFDAGGYIDSWTIGGVEILNRYDSMARGLQARCEWVDAESGELVRHAPVQGGSYYTLPAATPSGDVFSVQAAPAPLQHEVVQRGDGSTVIEIISAAIEFDPDGAFSVPGISSGHGGSKWNPIFWRGVTLTLRLTLNWRGLTGVHLLQTEWSAPFAVRSGWADMVLSAPLCLASSFNELHAFDAADGSGNLLSDGTPGTHFQADYRAYRIDPLREWADDEGDIGASMIPSGWGFVAGVNTAASLAVAMFGRPHTGLLADVSMADVPRGTCWEWLQNRTGTTGHDGAQVVAIDLPARLTNRFHADTQVRRLPRACTTYRFVLTGSLAEVQASAELLYQQRLH
jgi:hypothetical protein